MENQNNFISQSELRDARTITDVHEKIIGDIARRVAGGAAIEDGRLRFDEAGVIAADHATPSAPAETGKIITQSHLRQARNMSECSRDIQKILRDQIAAGASVEPGDLAFNDKENDIVAIIETQQPITPMKPRIRQAEIAHLFATQRWIEEALCAIHLRMLAGEEVEPGPYTCYPDCDPPGHISGWSGGGVEVHENSDHESYQPHPESSLLEEEEAAVEAVGGRWAWMKAKNPRFGKR